MRDARLLFCEIGRILGFLDLGWRSWRLWRFNVIIRDINNCNFLTFSTIYPDVRVSVLFLVLLLDYCYIVLMFSQLEQLRLIFLPAEELEIIH